MTAEEGWSALGTVALQAVGCKLNQAETDSLARKFLEAGYQVVAPDSPADIYVLNTCTVTRVADHKCRKLLRQAHSRNPDALIVATGCYVERAPAEVNGIEGVSLTVGNRDKERLVRALGEEANGRRPAAYGGKPDIVPLRTRALVKIQEGCTQRCAFCIVPRVRGPERSRPREDIIAEVRVRLNEGFREIVLTGTRIGRYDHEGRLQRLTQDILDESDVQRLRLSSLEPCDITPELLRLWQDSRLCPHIHLPLQSGSDTVLERMRRAYSTADYQRAVSLAREAIPRLALTTDIMVGFPGENEVEFDESRRFCERIGFARMHVFPYSPRPGTRAASMADVLEDGERKRRTRVMLDLAGRSSARFRERFLGQSMDVLWEGKRDGIWFGLTDNYIRVFVPSQRPLANQLLPASLVASHDGGLRGELTTRRPESCGARGAWP